MKPKDAPETLPRFEPLSPYIQDSSMDGRVKIRLARLQLEAQEKEQVHKADFELRLQIRKLEIEAEKEIKLKQLEVEATRLSVRQSV